MSLTHFVVPLITCQDFAFELQSSHFKWRWETNFAGYRSSAEILSKHLIFPLISVAHISLSSPDAVSSMTDADVEKVCCSAACISSGAATDHWALACRMWTKWVERLEELLIPMSRTLLRNLERRLCFEG